MKGEVLEGGEAYRRELIKITRIITGVAREGGGDTGFAIDARPARIAAAADVLENSRIVA